MVKETQISAIYIAVAPWLELSPCIAFAGSALCSFKTVKHCLDKHKYCGFSGFIIAVNNIHIVAKLQIFIFEFAKAIYMQA